MLKTMILAAATLTTMGAMAQTGGIWKKKVSRTIEMKEKDDNKVHHLKTAAADSTLAEMMVVTSMNGKLTLYSNIDANFSTKLTRENLMMQLGQVPDTMIMTDPVTNNNIMKIVRRDVNYDAIHQYRLAEDWTFSASTGKTDIQLSGIAPVIDIYGDDGTLRGVQAVFWARYADVQPILARYNQRHPTGTLEGKLWDDYFLSDSKPKEIK
jgi:hypothetical protein